MLGGNSRKIFEFKGLIGKVFRNKDLAVDIPVFLPILVGMGRPIASIFDFVFDLSKSAESGFAAAPRVALEAGTLRGATIRRVLSRLVDWMYVTALTARL